MNQTEKAKRFAELHRSLMRWALWMMRSSTASAIRP
jgi:hypothetical protein